MNCGRPLDSGPSAVAAGVLTPLPEDAATAFTPGPTYGAGAPTDDGLTAAEVPDSDLTRLAEDSGMRSEAGGGGPLVPGQTLGPRYHIIRLLGI